MTEELQGSTPTADVADLERIEEAADTSSKPHAQQPPTSDSVADNKADDTAVTQPDAPAASEVIEKKNEGKAASLTAKQKPAVVVKPAAGAKNGPTSPVVKRVCIEVTCKRISTKINVLLLGY